MLGYTKRLKAGDSVHESEGLLFALQQRVTNYEIQIQELQILCQRLESEASNMVTAAAQDVIDR